MALRDWLFGKSGPLQQLERMALGELETERLRLEARQDAIIGKVRTLEARKDALLREGATKRSDLERKAVAVRYRQVDAEAGDTVSQAALLSKHIRVLNRVAQLKRRERLLRNEGLWAAIARVDAADLEQFMVDARARALQGDRQATRLLDILEEPLVTSEEEDREIGDILAAMDALAEGRDTDQAIEAIEQEMSRRTEDREGAEG